MNITIIEQAPDIGGSEYYMLNLIKKWVSMGHSVRLLTNHQGFQKQVSLLGSKTGNLPCILDITGNVRGFVKSVLLSPYAWNWYSSTLKSLKSETDILLMSGYAEKILTSLVAHKLDIPVIWLEYPPVSRLLKRNLGIPQKLYQQAAEGVSQIIAISKRTYLDLVENLGINKQKVSLIYPGVELPTNAERKNSIKQAMLLKKNLGIENKMVIGNLSRLAPEKGQQDIIKLMTLFAKTRNDIVAVLFGEGPDKKRLRRLIQTNNLENKVLLAGYIENRQYAYGLFDAFIFPSSWDLEGFGLVLAEAMAMEVPIIAYNNTLTQEIVQNNKTGLLVEQGKIRALQKSVAETLGDKQKTAQRVISAKNLVRQQFNLDVQAKEIEKIMLRYKQES